MKTFVSPLTFDATFKEVNLPPTAILIEQLTTKFCRDVS